MPGCCRQAQGGGPSSANAHSPRCTRAAGCGLPPLVKMPRAHRLWFSLYRQSRPRITTRFTYDKRSVYFLMITAWRVDNFDHFFIHRVGTAISQVKAVLCVLPGSIIPSISPRRTQALRCFAQVIHMVVHSTPGPSMIIYWTSPPPLAGSTAACVSFRSSTAREADPPVRSRGGPAEGDAMSGRSRARVKPGSCAW